MTFPSASLVELCDVVIGKTPSRSNRTYWGEGFPWLSISDIRELDIWATREQITSSAVANCRCRLVQPGTVLLSFKLSVGKVGIARIPLFTNEAIAALPIRDEAKLDAGFLGWALRSINLSEGLDRAAKGLTLNKEKLERIRIPLPTIVVQRRIATILDKADALRTKRRKALEELDRLAHTIFVQMFGDPTANPKQWTRVSLGELLESGPQNGLYKPSSSYGSGALILRIDAFYDGVVTGLSTLKRVQVDAKELALYGLNEDEIVINRVNSPSHLGKSALIPALAEPVVFESNMMRLALDKRRVLPSYVISFLQTDYIKSQIRAASKDAINQSSINQQDVKGFLVNLPPLSLQQSFAERLAELARLRMSFERAAEETNALFHSLQHSAFKGGI